MANGKRIDYDEAKVRMAHLSNRREVRILERDGNLKFYEAAVMACDGKRADEYRQKLHDNLDEMLDTTAEMYSMMGLVEPPKGE